MIVRKLREDDLVDAVRIIALSFERELIAIFKDVDIARDIATEFFRVNRDGCYVAEEGRVVAFAWLIKEKPKIFKFLKSQMSFVDGLRSYILLRFFLRRPKKGEGFLVFIAVSPLRRGSGIGTRFMNEVVSIARSEKINTLKCMVPAEGDALIFFKNLGFEINGIFENKLAEKYFSCRSWVLLCKDLSA
jgi:ribosomal protein S18 acetylase RimI-like enzyme